MNDQFDDWVDEQGQLCLGAWRWASRCPTCGTMVYERVESLVADTFVRIDATSLMSIFQQDAQKGCPARPQRVRQT